LDGEKGMPIKRGLGYLETLSNFLNQEMKRVDRRLLIGLLILAFLIRIPLLMHPEVIHNDGTEYIRHARQILTWDWTTGKSHPFYPTLIAIFHFLTPSDELAGIWVSVILGALVVLPVFYLGRAIFNERIGIIAAFFATFHPFLYIYSGSVLTESTFHLLLATTVLFGWNAFNKGRFRDALLFGLFTAFSYLTRPEGIGFLVIFAVWVLLVRPPLGKRPWFRRVGIVCLALFSFLVFSFPYLMQLKKNTGRWQVSHKVSVSLGSFSKDDSEVPIELLPLKKKFTLSSFIHSPLTLAEKIGGGILESLYTFQQVYPAILAVLLVLGLLITRGHSLSLKGNLHLVSYLAYFFGLVHPFFWISRRFSSHVVTIALPWAAFGFVAVAQWVSKKLKNGALQRKFPAMLFIFILFALFVQGQLVRSRDSRVLRKESGLWMKEHLPAGSVMGSRPQEAFYAELPWVKMLPGSYESILEAARSKGVRYLVIDENIEGDSPGFLKKLSNDDLITLGDWKRKGQRVTVFEILYRAKW
jgi:4-amino-4-deoxy-L-arabinose transferase-like glycosyltransferase